MHIFSCFNPIVLPVVSHPQKSEFCEIFSRMNVAPYFYRDFRGKRTYLLAKSV